MTAYWLALGFSLFVFAFALWATFRPPDLGKLDERQIRNYRLGLEGRRGPFSAGNLFVIALAVLWLIVGVETIVWGSPLGFAYLVPALLLMTTLWLMRRYRINSLHRLGDRGVVPKTASEENAKVWYRLWGAIAVVGFVGPQVMEFNYQRSFSTEDSFSDAANTVHFLLGMFLIVGGIGLIATFFNTRESEKKESPARKQPRDEESQEG